jgi:hypothetical protein
MVEDMVLGKIIAAGVAAAVTVPLMIVAVGIGIWGHRRKEAWRSVCRERERELEESLTGHVKPAPSGTALGFVGRGPPSPNREAYLGPQEAA